MHDRAFHAFSRLPPWPKKDCGTMPKLDTNFKSKELFGGQKGYCKSLIINDGGF